MVVIRVRIIALAGLFFVILPKAGAESLPEWELGVALGTVSLPYYRGASDGRQKTLPLPLAIVRKDALKAGANSRWGLFGSQRLGWDVSFGGNLPVPTGGDGATRVGMPRLDATLELGPRLGVRLWRYQRHQMVFALPLRLMTSVSFSRIATQGWGLSPFVSYDYQRKGRNAWKLEALMGPLYGSAGVHQYYYGVDQTHATDKRVFFKANQGYGGSRVTVYVQKSLKRLWVSAFARLDILAGASFEKSPLMEKEVTWLGGFVIGWVIIKSPNKVFTSN